MWYVLLTAPPPPHVSRLVCKYHPKHVAMEKELATSNLQARVQAFLFLMETGRVGRVPLSYQNTDEIVRTMDAGKLRKAVAK